MATSGNLHFALGHSVNTLRPSTFVGIEVGEATSSTVVVVAQRLRDLNTLLKRVPFQGEGGSSVQSRDPQRDPLDQGKIHKGSLSYAHCSYVPMYNMVYYSKYKLGSKDYEKGQKRVTNLKPCPLI